MKLSIVVICWNDAKYIVDCIQSIYDHPPDGDYEIILTDNASTDGSVRLIQERFPRARIVQNGKNIGFGPANNEGMKVATGEYVLILNPDTLVHSQALTNLTNFADAHPRAGAFGCRVLNVDGSIQDTAQPPPTVPGYLVAALHIRWLGRLSDRFLADKYEGWDARSVRPIGFQAACALMLRQSLVQQLGGFDSRFAHQFEDADLCRRVWQTGQEVLFCPDAEITHIGGHNRGGYPIHVVLATERSKCRYFHKHFGLRGLRRIRYVNLVGISLRLAACTAINMVRSRVRLRERIANYRVLLRWYAELNPIRFIEKGEEPGVLGESLSTEPKLNESRC